MRNKYIKKCTQIRTSIWCYWDGTRESLEAVREYVKKEVEEAKKNGIENPQIELGWEEFDDSGIEIWFDCVHGRTGFVPKPGYFTFLDCDCHPMIKIKYGHHFMPRIVDKRSHEIKYALIEDIDE